MQLKQEWEYLNGNKMINATPTTIYHPLCYIQRQQTKATAECRKQKLPILPNSTELGNKMQYYMLSDCHTSASPTSRQLHCYATRYNITYATHASPSSIMETT